MRKTLSKKLRAFLSSKKSRTRAFRPLLETLEGRLALATFTVVNTDDNGAGSLRQAILDSNNNSGPDEIRFNIAGAGVHTIKPDIKLPDIQDSVLIDGYTQPGASPNLLAVGNNAVLLIEINGDIAGETNGLVITAPDCTIRGLVVNGFERGTSSTQGRGIVALGEATTNLVIAGNFVGVNPAGTAAVPNEGNGIFVLSAPGARIGGANPADRNVVSGNGQRGIFVNATNVQIKGNYAGTNAVGTSAIPNFFEGILVAANTGYQIGGAAAGEGNVISGNNFAGLTLNAVADSFVQGNKIGVGADGVTPLGNGDAGLFISNLAGPNSNNLVGGPSAALANTIAFNDKNGITVQDPAATGNRFQANSIFENGLLGIDLDKDGVIANDDGDADTGANGLQNKPVLANALLFAGAVRINGSLNSVPNETFRIELFSIPIPDATGGEGQTFLGAAEVASDAAGNVPFQIVVNVPVGTVFSSTATRLSTKDTSEFSNNVTVLPATTDLGVSITPPVGTVKPGQNFVYTVTITNSGPDPAENVVLNIPVPTGTTGFDFDQLSGQAFLLSSTATNLQATLTSFSPGTATFRIEVSTAGTLTDGTIVLLTAGATTSTTDTQPGNDTAAASATVLVRPPAGSAGVSNNVLFVTGTAANDSIVVKPVSGQARVILNGKTLGNFALGSFASVSVLAGAGNDSVVIVTTLNKPATLDGEAGNDSLVGGNSPDTLIGGPGKDTLQGLGGDDSMSGGEGNDLLLGGNGNDSLDGDEGNDTVNGGAGNDRLLGGLGNDKVFGEAGNDFVLGEEGNDQLFGGAGRDILIGGTGTDTLFGEAGDDILVGGKTSADNDAALAALILAEWTSGNPYNARVNNILGLGVTVHEDNAVDTLFGQGNQDWFLVGLGDKVKDKAANELVN